MDTVVIKNIKGYFSQYNGQQVTVVSFWPSLIFGMSLRVLASDGKEFTVGKNEYAATDDQQRRYADMCRGRKSPIPSALRRMQRNSSRSTTFEEFLKTLSGSLFCAATGWPVEVN